MYHRVWKWEEFINFWLTQGEVVALDRIKNKINRIRDNAQVLQLRSIKAFCFNSIQAVSTDVASRAEGMNIWSFVTHPACI